jgi:hypothetical protein
MLNWEGRLLSSFELVQNNRQGHEVRSFIRKPDRIVPFKDTFRYPNH